MGSDSRIELPYRAATEHKDPFFLDQPRQVAERTESDLIRAVFDLDLAARPKTVSVTQLLWHDDSPESIHCRLHPDSPLPYHSGIWQLSMAIQEQGILERALPEERLTFPECCSPMLPWRRAVAVADRSGAAGKLKGILASFDSVGVAFSGGVDSSFLLAAAVDSLGKDRVIALTAVSDLVPDRDTLAASEVAALLGVRHITVRFPILENALVAANAPDRCYHCKKAVFTALLEEAKRHGVGALVHGANLDDTKDFRPGQKAADELGVRAPLREAGLGKAEIRALSRAAGSRTGPGPPWHASPRESRTARRSRSKPCAGWSAPKSFCGSVSACARCGSATTCLSPASSSRRRISRGSWKPGPAPRSSERCRNLDGDTQRWT